MPPDTIFPDLTSPHPSSFGRNGPLRLPELELLQRVGSGSYGEVWLARNPLGTFRAVKIVRRGEFDADRPYEREFGGIQKFEPISRSHEGFVDLLQVGRNDSEGYFYYVMELADALDGSSTEYEPRTLAAEVKARGALALDECVKIARTLTGALAELHRYRLVHRDIKPSNIIFVNGVPKLADIGLVASASESRSFVGTEGFIPPEGPGSPQADLYSLGVVLYVISTGKSHADFPEPPGNLLSGPDHSRWLEWQAIIYRACQRDLKQRYPSAQAMLIEIEMLDRGQSITARRAWQRRLALGQKAALPFLLFGLLAGAFSIWTRQTPLAAFFGGVPPSKVDEANVLTDEALRIVRSDDYDRLGHALTNLHRAISLDTNFALPYVGLLELRGRDNRSSTVSLGDDELASILQHLEKLTPDLAATHSARAIVRFRALDFTQAREEARLATKADPDYEFAHTLSGWLLLGWDWPNEAREQFEIARKLNPANLANKCFLANTYYLERNYAEAIKGHLEATRLGPRFSLAWGCLGEIYEAMGDLTNSIACEERSQILQGESESEAKELGDALRAAAGRGGVLGYWQEQWGRAEANPDGDRYWKAICQLELGNRQAALKFLNESLGIAQKPNGFVSEPNLHWLLFHHYWDTVRDDPDFKAILDKVGLSKVMRPRK